MKLPIAIAAAFASVALTGLAVAGPADDIIAKEKCSKCHTAQTTKKAPSWASVAEKYKGNAGAEAKLVTMLKTGGTEDHPKVAASDADLKVRICLSRAMSWTTRNGRHRLCCPLSKRQLPVGQHPLRGERT